MDIEAPALVIGVLPHGEHGAVVRFLTHDHGLVAGYVRGGRSRRLRPVLGLGNSVALQLHARLDSQLGSATVELGSSRAGLALDALGAASLEWLTGLTATLLTEGVPHPPLYSVLDGLLEAMTLGVEPARAMAGVARYELLLMAELGFGPDLSNCVVTGATTDLPMSRPNRRMRSAAAPDCPMRRGCCRYRRCCSVPMTRRHGMMSRRHCTPPAISSNATC